MDIGETILFRHSKAGELCERFPFYIVLKIVGEYSTYRGWPMLSIKGQKWRNWTGNVEGTPHYTMYPESIQDVVEVVGLARKRERKFVLSVQDTRLPPCANGRSFSFFR